MPTWPAAVLCDFDGVIVNSEPLHYYAFHTVLKKEGIELSEREYYHDLIGYDDKGAFRHIYEKRKRELDPKTFLRLMTTKSQQMMRQIRERKYAALPGVEEFVRGLWRDYPMAIVSAALREEIEAMLEGVSLRDCFRVIVAAEDVTIPKPNPAPYLHAANLVGEMIGRKITPGDCLIVEDAASVIGPAKDAGFRVLAVTTSHPPEKLAAADWVAKSLHVDTVLEKIPQLKFLR